MKRIRMLLRVSSDQQLEADGDLSIQRKILMEYIQNKKIGFWMEKNISKEVKVHTKHRIAERNITGNLTGCSK